MTNSTNENRAVGLVSIGNPVTLIASLDKFKTVCAGYKIYICLNISQEHITVENYQKLLNNSYKIIAHYEPNFREIVVIENAAKVWLTHGMCLDMLYNFATEEELVMFEEDAYLFSNTDFEEKFRNLQTKDLFCVVAPKNPNNYNALFSKLNIFPNTINMPGKESIFFIRKSLLSKYDWVSFDYVKWNSGVVYTRPEGTKIHFQEEIHFDTFEFFSLNCWMNTSIAVGTYEEQNYDYWVPEGRNAIHEFYQQMTNPMNYMHYFNGSLFQYLDYHGPNNSKFYKNMMHTAPHFGQYLYHMSTYIIHLGILRAVKKKYVEILGSVEYNLNKRSIKNSLSMLINYFGYFKIRHQYKLASFLKFTYKFTNRYHGIK